MRRSDTDATEQIRGLSFLASIIAFCGLVAGGVLRSWMVYHELPNLSLGYQHRLNRDDRSAASIQTFQTAAKLDFDLVRAQLDLLNAAKTAGDHQAILVARRGLLAISPYDAISHGELASAALNVGNQKEAMVHAEIAVQLEPNNADLQCTYGAALLADGKKQTAANAYRKALEIEPGMKAAQLALDHPLRDF